MKLLALDLGTHTGWAYSEDPGIIMSGTWHLATPAEIRKQGIAELDRCCDMRFNRLKEHIESFGPLDYIFFEDVQFCTSQLQAQLWAGLRTVVVLHFPKSTVRCIPVGTLKKLATGHGNATKEMMLAALLVKYPERFEGRMEKGYVYVYKKSEGRVDDNEADAFHILMWGMSTLK